MLRCKPLIKRSGGVGLGYVFGNGLAVNAEYNHLSDGYDRAEWARQTEALHQRFPRHAAEFPDLAPPWVWPLFALAYELGVVLGVRLQRRWLLGRLGGKVELAGEWLTLATVSSLFVANYAFNVVSVIRPDVAALRGTLMFYVLIIGPLSGSLLGRALHVARGAVRP